jgi:hypothetical protein
MKKLFILSLFIAFTGGIFAQIPCVGIQWNEDNTEFTVVNFNYNPLSLPIQGLSENMEVLVKREPYAIPEYDPRLKRLVTSYDISEEYDTEHPTSRMWVKTYSLLDRSTDEKIISVSEAENDANYQVFPTQDHFKYMVLAIAIIDRKASGMTISAAQQTLLNRVQNRATKIWQNHVISQQKAAAIEAAQEVDLDEGWENIDPEQ